MQCQLLATPKVSRQPSSTGKTTHEEQLASSRLLRRASLRNNLYKASCLQNHKNTLPPLTLAVATQKCAPHDERTLPSVCVFVDLGGVCLRVTEKLAIGSCSKTSSIDFINNPLRLDCYICLQHDHRRRHRHTYFTISSDNTVQKTVIRHYW